MHRPGSPRTAWRPAPRRGTPPRRGPRFARPRASWHDRLRAILHHEESLLDADNTDRAVLEERVIVPRSGEAGADRAGVRVEITDLARVERIRDVEDAEPGHVIRLV